ncbi:MAG TPA: AAA family ATPase [Candidatus Nanopelagicaceae bacterium]|nr:AAA family ATPase [Candidatus Nanopelagicaceae bacterium]
MKVLSVKLERFGALRGIYNLDPGITVIFGPNESGKSTLHTAMRVALAGVDLPSRGRMPKESEEVLRRFRPWRGASFTVEAEVEIGSGRYRFIRDLTQPDNCQVLDLVRGGDVTASFRRGRTVDVSVMLGMSREAFLAVSTVAQDQILEISGTSLQADLQRATSTSGADTTVRAAIELLRNWRQEHLRADRTTTRPMDKVAKLLDETQGRLGRALEAREHLGVQLVDQEELRRRLQLAEREARVGELAWKAAELAELDQDLIAIEEIDSSLGTLPELVPPPDSTEVREAALGASQLAQQLEEAEAKVAELTPADAAQANLAASLSVSELNFLADAVGKPVPALPAQAGGAARLELLDRRSVALHRWSSDGIAILGGIAGALLIFKAVSGQSTQLQLTLFLGGLAVMVVAASAFLYLQRRLRRLLATAGFMSVAEMRKARRSRDPEVLKAVAAQEDVLAQRARARKRMGEIGLSQFSEAQLRQLASEVPPLQDALQKLASWQATATRARDDLLARAQRVGLQETEPRQIAALLDQRAAEAAAAEEAERRRGELRLRREERLNGRELRTMVARSGELRAELGKGVRTGPAARANRPAAELRVEYDQARARRDQIKGELLPLEGSLDQQLRAAGDLVELEEQVVDLRAQLAGMERTEAAITLAISELQNAEGEIQNSLAPVLADGLSQRLSKLTHKRYEQAWVDPADLSMHVAAPRSSRQVPVENLSQGTQEQIYVCLRMVLAQALSPKGEQLPLIFDDPSVNSDDHRCYALLDTLLELSETSQVVIFSHERRVAEWAARQSVPVLGMSQVPAAADEELAPAAGPEGG